MVGDPVRLIVAAGVVYVGYALITGRSINPFALPFWVLRFTRRQWAKAASIAGHSAVLSLWLGVLAVVFLVLLVKEMAEKGVELEKLTPLGLFLVVYGWKKLRKKRKTNPLPGRRR